jgi:dTDP-glucose pyrophosphorylase
MPDWTNIVIGPDASIQQSMECLDASARQIVLVVESERLVGTVTDGDIRRALLRRLSLDQPVSTIMNRAPRTVGPDADAAAVRTLMHEHKIHQVPVVDEGGRLIGLHELDALLQGPDQEAWVVLMAGGLGSRLHPLTQDTPKPMLKVGGKPVIHTIVETLVDQGFRRLFLSVNYRAEQIKDYFGAGEQFGATIEYLHETEPRGTAGALSLLPVRPDVPVLVMNADVLTSVNFANLMRFHMDSGAAATMCVREYAVNVPYGVVEIEDNRIVALNEKPQKRFFINAGIYALSPDSLGFVPGSGLYDMPTLFRKLMAQELSVSAFPLREYWMDIGHLEDLDRARTEYQGIFG